MTWVEYIPGAVLKIWVMHKLSLDNGTTGQARYLSGFRVIWSITRNKAILVQISTTKTGSLKLSPRQIMTVTNPRVSRGRVETNSEMD